MLEGVFIGFLLGKIRGGRLSNFRSLHVRWFPLIVFALGMQIVELAFCKFSFMIQYEGYINAVTLFCIGIFLVLNRNKKGLFIILIGVVLNLVVILMNKGRMPISMDSLQFIGNEGLIEGIKKGEILKYVLSTEALKYSNLLGKYIVVPKPYPFAKVMSIGDLLISLGLILSIQGQMLKSRFGQKVTTMIKIPYKGKE